MTVATGVFDSWLWRKAEIVYSGWPGEKQGLVLLGGLGAAIPLSIVALTLPLWLPHIL